MRDDRLAVGGAIVGMDRLDDVAGGERRIFRLHPEHVAQLLGKIDFAALQIGIVDGVIDRLHRERVALFDAGRIARGGLTKLRFLRRNRHQTLRPIVIVVMPCIVGVSRDDGFVSSVSFARFLTIKSARSRLAPMNLTQGEAIQMIPIAPSGRHRNNTHRA